MKRLFGTDGIRGMSGEFPLDPRTIASVGAALVRRLRAPIEAAAPGGAGLSPRILVGRDTRESGPWIQDAFVSGVIRAGGAAESAGVIPTPGLAYLTGRERFDAGVMISASHNPFRDNGIKIFGPEQIKLTDADERALEEDILREVSLIAARAVRSGCAPSEVRAGAAGSRGDEDRGAAERFLPLYKDFLLESVSPGLSLSGLRIALDCANGAAASIAPALFAALGADVLATHAAPDGRNINEACGALHPEALARDVASSGADAGFAFDGDADRCLAVDRTGRILDGDFILYIEAQRLKARGLLRGDVVVATVMTNLWLEKRLREDGVRLLRTPVGDKYVLEAMLREGAVLGGEQSGHVIFLDRSRAGDGILTSLRIAEALVQDGLDLARLASGIERFPQVLLNVPVSSKPPLETHAEIGPAIRRAEEELAGDGRVLVRYSGTERLARVMVEGTDAARIESAARAIADTIREHIGA